LGISTNTVLSLASKLEQVGQDISLDKGYAKETYHVQARLAALLAKAMEDDSQDFQDFWGFGEDGLRWAW
jgi:hypothetical protein